jgi:hypothetical protein
VPKHAPEFTDSEKWIVGETLKERWQDHTPELREVETEIRIYPDDRELTDCSGLYWESGDCKFCISKTGHSRFRAMFFYRVRDRYTTDREEYDDLVDCVVTMLKHQVDVELKREGLTEDKK